MTRTMVSIAWTGERGNGCGGGEGFGGRGGGAGRGKGEVILVRPAAWGAGRGEMIDTYEKSDVSATDRGRPVVLGLK